MPANDERRLTPEGEAPSQEDRTAASETSIPSHMLPDPSHILNGVFVVLVTHRVAGEIRYRRRTFFSLAAAQRHADRLTMNGRAASVTLCRLSPVHEFGGGWPA